MMQLLKLTAWGYGFIVLLIGCIVYIWHNEWQEVEALESDNRPYSTDRVFSIG